MDILSYHVLKAIIIISLTTEKTGTLWLTSVTFELQLSQLGQLQPGILIAGAVFVVTRSCDVEIKSNKGFNPSVGVQLSAVRSEKQPPQVVVKGNHQLIQARAYYSMFVIVT